MRAQARNATPVHVHGWIVADAVHARERRITGEGLGVDRFGTVASRIEQLHVGLVREALNGRGLGIQDIENGVELGDREERPQSL